MQGENYKERRYGEMMDCENCIKADISYGTRIVEKGNMKLIQNGGVNVQCKAGKVNITIKDSGDMICDGYEERTDVKKD